MDGYLACSGSGDSQVAVNLLSNTSALISEVNPVTSAASIDAYVPQPSYFNVPAVVSILILVLRFAAVAFWGSLE